MSGLGDRPAQLYAKQGGKSEQGRATAVANYHPGRPAGKCSRKDTADDLYGTGNGEMVRQERTAIQATVSALKTPPPARPSKLEIRPGCEGLQSLIQRVGRIPNFGRAVWQQPVKINDRHLQNSAYRPTLF